MAWVALAGEQPDTEVLAWPLEDTNQGFFLDPHGNVLGLAKPTVYLDGPMGQAAQVGSRIAYRNTHVELAFVLLAGVGSAATVDDQVHLEIAG